MKAKHISPFWQGADPLTVNQAAALMAGEDPNNVDSSGEYFRDPETGLTDSTGIAHIQTASSILRNAIIAGKLAATIRRDAWMRGYDEEPGEGEQYADSGVVVPADAESKIAMALLGRRAVIYKVDPHWGKTTIDRADLLAWLDRNVIPRGFFSRFASPTGSTPTQQGQNPNADDTEPESLPQLLDAANIAYRAVKNGYGNQDETFKNRVMAYLGEKYPTLQKTTKEQIATIVNPDKSPGRKKRT